jgi:hypothetical protein
MFLIKVIIKRNYTENQQNTDILGPARGEFLRRQSATDAASGLVSNPMRVSSHQKVPNPYFSKIL